MLPDRTYSSRAAYVVRFKPVRVSLRRVRCFVARFWSVQRGVLCELVRLPTLALSLPRSAVNNPLELPLWSLDILWELCGAL